MVGCLCRVPLLRVWAISRRLHLAAVLQHGGQRAGASAASCPASQGAPYMQSKQGKDEMEGHSSGSSRGGQAAAAAYWPGAGGGWNGRAAVIWSAMLRTCL